jgi:NAD+ synthase
MRNGKPSNDGWNDAQDEFLGATNELEALKVEISEFIQTEVSNADRSGVVVPMSGGIDSTLTTMLAVEALGSDRVLGLGLPSLKTDSCHTSEAHTIAEGLGIEFCEVQLRPILDIFKDAVAPTITPPDETTAIGNVIARLRMVCAYYAANTQSRLVCGTANRSELLLGYFTKYGDGGADLFPLGDLYKTEVWSLAHHMGVPRRIIEKDPTAGLRAGQTDEADLGATYDVIDPLLRWIVDRGVPVEAAADALSVDREIARQIASRYINTLHKRAVPPTPGIGKRSIAMFGEF